MIEIRLTIEELPEGMRIMHCTPPSNNATALEVIAHDTIHEAIRKALEEQSQGPVIRIDLPTPTQPINAQN